MPSSGVFGQHVTAADGVNSRHLGMVIGIIEKSLHAHLMDYIKGSFML